MGERPILEHNPRLIVAVQERLSAWGVEDIIWDSDDTLVDTHPLYTTAISDIAGTLLGGSANPRYSRVEEVVGLMNVVIDAVRPLTGVHPEIMFQTTTITSARLGIDLGNPVLEKALNRLHQLYEKDIPEVFEGVEWVVPLLGKGAKRTIVATHNQLGRATAKLEGAGILELFDEVIAFEELRRSKSSQWEGKFKARGIVFPKCLVIGNNYYADVLVPAKLGARVIWLDRGGAKKRYGEHGLVVVNPEVLLQQVMRVESIPQVVAAVLMPEKYRLRPEDLA